MKYNNHQSRPFPIRDSYRHRTSRSDRQYFHEHYRRRFYEYNNPEKSYQPQSHHRRYDGDGSGNSLSAKPEYDQANHYWPNSGITNVRGNDCDNNHSMLRNVAGSLPANTVYYGQQQQYQPHDSNIQTVTNQNEDCSGANDDAAASKGPLNHTDWNLHLAETANRNNDVPMPIKSDEINALVAELRRWHFDGAIAEDASEANIVISNDDVQCTMAASQLDVIAYPFDEQQFVDEKNHILSTVDILQACQRTDARISSITYKYVPIVTKLKTVSKSGDAFKEQCFVARRGIYPAQNEL